MGTVSCLWGKDTFLNKEFSSIPYYPIRDINSVAGEFKLIFGHRRLSILDLSPLGHMPMSYKNNRYWITYNGEIYNYVELRSELESLGHEFKTKSDTEVLVHGYEEWHTDLPKHLRGMFAFAIHDKNRNEIFLARDNFGIKPLYYAKMNDSFMFASEIKSFLDDPDFKKEFNEEILETYLEFSFVPTNETFFKGVYRLDAGCSLLYKDEDIKINKYFKLDFKEDKMSFTDAVKNISDVMEDSVKRHLIADVEVGSFLSSGIDSSYIVSLARPHKTYTVGYENKKYDEINYAKDLADKLGIKNESKIIKKDEYLELFVNLQLSMHQIKAFNLKKLKDKMNAKINQTELDATTRYELHTRLEGMPKHNKLCHGDFNPSNIIVKDDGTLYIIDWSHATQGNASADVARTYLLFWLSDDVDGANKYLDLYCEKSGVDKKYVQSWLPIVAASQSVKGHKKERELLLSWVNVVDYE